MVQKEALCKLLEYLGHHTLYTPTDHLKEYTIATEVFGRPADFNPQTASYVRVQMGRLRTKLAQSYEHEGIANTVLVDVPKGRYLLSFVRRDIPAEQMSPVEADEKIDRPAALKTHRYMKFRRCIQIVLGLMIAISIAAAA